MDMPQRAILELTGKDRHAFLNNLLTNQTWDKPTKAAAPIRQGVYAFFLNNKGRIVADMNVIETPATRRCSRWTRAWSRRCARRSTSTCSPSR